MRVVKQKDTQTEEDLELAEDIAIAKEVQEYYDTHGADGYKPYSEYRKQRLGEPD